MHKKQTAKINDSKCTYELKKYAIQFNGYLNLMENNNN